MIDLSEHCPNLEELNLYDSSRDLNTLSSVSFPNLKLLYLYKCISLKDKAVRVFLEGCPELKELNLWGNEYLTEAFCPSVIFEKLTYLNLFYCEGIKDVASIFKACPNLKKLNVAGRTTLLSQDDFSSISSTKLEEMWISDDDPVFSAIVKISPKLKIVRASLQ